MPVNHNTVEDGFDSTVSSLIILNSKLDKNTTANGFNPLDLMFQQTNHNTQKVRYLSILITFSVVAVLSILINTRAFYIVFVTSERLSR